MNKNSFIIICGDNTILNCRLFFIMGILSTFAALQIFGFSLYNYALILLIVLNIPFLLEFKTIYKNPINYLFLIFMFSYITNLYFLKDGWYLTPITFILKYSLVMILINTFKSTSFAYLRDCFFRGLYISTIIQLCWEYIELLYWNMFHKSFNALIFGELLKINIGGDWITFHGTFRPTGLSWESANLSMSLIFGFILSRNWLLKILFFISVFFTGSRTGILGMLVVVMYIFFRKYILKVKSIHISRLFLLKRLGLIMVGTIGLIIVIKCSGGIIENLSTFFNNSINRLLQANLGTDISANRHVDYYSLLPNIFLSYSSIHLPFGFGTISAGLPYSLLLGFNLHLSQWNPESDYVVLLVGNGLVGLTLYLYLFYYELKINKKNFTSIAMILAIFICGIMYVYIRTWTTLVLAILSVQVNSNTNIIRGEGE